jgi:hypothetical protein
LDSAGKSSVLLISLGTIIKKIANVMICFFKGKSIFLPLEFDSISKLSCELSLPRELYIENDESSYLTCLATLGYIEINDI